MEETGGSTDRQIPYLSVDGFCEETWTVYEFCVCYWHGHAFPPFRGVSTLVGDTSCEVPTDYGENG